MIKEYVFVPATLPRDPARAMADGETEVPGAGVMTHPQPAVDAARWFVEHYDGPELPRATVTGRVRHYRNPRNAPHVIFRAWRTPDGEYMEERIEKPK